MGNRLSNPNIQFFNNSGQPLTGGTLAFYTTGTTTPATTYSNRTLGIANANPIALDAAGRAGDIFLDPGVTYKAVLADANGAVIWTKDPVVDFAASINASLQVTAGNPNTQIAGIAGAVGGASASMAFDITNNLLYICTTTGTATTAVWTLVGANALTGNEDVVTASTYTVILGDAGRIKTANNASGPTWTLTAAATIGAGKLFNIINIGAGILTINPSGSDKLDGATTRALAQYEALLIECTGSAYRTMAAYSIGSFPAEVTVASAATANILGAASEAVAISGTTTITSFGTGPNRKRFCRATGAFTITYNATSLITPGAANITTVAGDTFIVVSDASSNARIVSYTQVTGAILSTPEVTVASAATTNILGAASEAVAISGTTTITSFGTGPNRVRFVRATGAFTITYNATSLITPGALNIQAAAGDTFIVVSDASSNARIVSYLAAANPPYFGTGLTGQLFGLTLSNDSGGTTAIAVAAGSARDSTDVDTMVLSSALTGKVLGTAWSVGNAGGLLDTGAVGNNTYHIFLIKRTDTGVVDALASLSATAPTMPTNYTEFRRIGSIVRSGGAIKLFKQDGDRFRWTAASVQDVNATNPGTAAVTRTLTVPTGIVVWADIAMSMTFGTNATIRTLITSLDETDRAPATTDYNFFAGFTAASSFNSASGSMLMKTNTSAQIRTRQDNSGASDVFTIMTFGWIDQRGRLY